MRLEPDIEPTKSRAATVSSKEMARFREIQNVVRNTKCNYTKIDFLLRLFLRILICSSSKVRQGRIEKITEKELVFKNGHIIPVSTPDTLFIDCSATATGFSHPKVIFSGDTINLQMVIIPQPCYSSSIIAALELKYPEDEAKKNQVIPVVMMVMMMVMMMVNQVIPVGINHESAMQWGPEAYWVMTRDQTLNAPVIGKLLGLNWMRRSRLSGMKFFGTMTMIKLIFSMRKVEKAMIENLNKMEEVDKEAK